MVQGGRALAAGVAAVLLLVACGDDEESSSNTTVAPTTSTTLSQIQLDEQKAQRIVLTAADLPGYTIDPPEPDDPVDAEAEAQVSACANNDPIFLRVGEEDDPRGASSPEFSKGETVTVGSDVTFAETEDQARAAMTAVSAASFPTCFSRAFAAVVRQEGSLTNVTVSTTKLPAMTVGDQSVGYRSVVRARAEGTAVTLYVDFVFIRSGRAFGVLNLTSLPTPFPEAERLRLATAIAGRMAAP